MPPFLSATVNREEDYSKLVQIVLALSQPHTKSQNWPKRGRSFPVSTYQQLQRVRPDKEKTSFSVSPTYTTRIYSTGHTTSYIDSAACSTGPALNSSQYTEYCMPIILIILIILSPDFALEYLNLRARLAAPTPTTLMTWRYSTLGRCAASRERNRARRAKSGGQSI